MITILFKKNNFKTISVISWQSLNFWRRKSKRCKEKPMEVPQVTDNLSNVVLYKYYHRWQPKDLTSQFCLIVAK